MTALLSPDNILHAVSFVLIVIIPFITNHVSPSSKIGSLLHWLSGNGPKIQAAIVAFETPKPPSPGVPVKLTPPMGAK